MYLMFLTFGKVPKALSAVPNSLIVMEPSPS